MRILGFDTWKRSGIVFHISRYLALCHLDMWIAAKLNCLASENWEAEKIFTSARSAVASRKVRHVPLAPLGPRFLFVFLPILYPGDTNAFTFGLLS